MMAVKKTQLPRPPEPKYPNTLRDRDSHRGTWSTALQGLGSDLTGQTVTARSLSVRDRLRLIASGPRWDRCKVAVRRAFAVSNGQPICVGDVLARAYPRLKAFKDYHRWSARRALLQVAVVVGRNRYGRGRPNLWVPNSAIGIKREES